MKNYVRKSVSVPGNNIHLHSIYSNVHLYSSTLLITLILSFLSGYLPAEQPRLRRRRVLCLPGVAGQPRLRPRDRPAGIKTIDITRERKRDNQSVGMRI